MSEKKETYKLFNLPWYYFAVFAVVILLATYCSATRFLRNSDRIIEKK